MYTPLLLTFSYVYIVIAILSDYTDAFPEQGKWKFTVKHQSCNYFHVNKALYKNSKISMKVLCDPSNDSNKQMKIKIGWTVRESPCFVEYLGPEISMPDYLRYYYYCPVSLLGDFGYSQVHYLKSGEMEVDCNHVVSQYLIPVTDPFKGETVGINYTGGCTYPKETCNAIPPPPILNYPLYDNSESGIYDDAENMGRKRKKRAAMLNTPVSNSTKIGINGLSTPDHQLTVPFDGIYLLILYVKSADEAQRYDAVVNIEIKGDHGYLSANEWPLLPFYGIMSFVYLSFAIIWLIVSAMQWRELLRIQFWIGAVILLGMIEKAVFYAEYQSINSTGQSVKGAVLFAELLSCLKRTLARMLVIIVSLGFGIVKPRLGPMLHRVVCVGTMYFVMSALEATLRIYKPKNEPNNKTLMADIPLAVLDSIICWWVFSSLVQTIRTLRLRRNLVKLQLYRQFTNIDICCACICNIHGLGDTLSQDYAMS